MTSLCCPLCSVALSPASLEAHLREELDFPHLRCRLCRLDFTSSATARAHFAGAFSEHTGQVPALLRLNGDAEKEARLEELARLARGGQREVERRLCVCGQCQLLCREDFRYVSGGQGDGQASEAQLLPRPAHETFRQNTYQEPTYRDEAVSYANTQNVNTWPQPVEGLAETLGHAEQLGMEASEPENQPMDVKPNLEDLKPQLSADGKVACIQCGLRVGKDQFKKHAIGAHSKARPYNCNLCPTSEKTKGELMKHQRKAHQTQMTSETFTFAGSETMASDLMEQCFGATKDVDWARLRCKPCDKLVNKMHLKYHVSTTHLKKPLHACKLCDHTSCEFTAAGTNLHVKKVHKRQPGPDTIDSSQAQHYAPIIKNMIPQFFDN